MSQKDLFFIGFVLTMVAAGVAWVLALAVYRADRKDYVHRVFSVTLLFMGLWFLSGFIDRIFTSPNLTATLWSYRWAYAAGIISATLFLLLSTGLYGNAKPKKVVYRTVLCAGIAVAAMSFSPWVIKGAGVQNGVPTAINGPLHPLAAAMVIIPCATAVYLLLKKWRRSAGIDRSRTSVVLSSLFFFLPVVAVLVFVLPPILKSDAYSHYAFLAGLIPIGFIAYAVLHMRLLDTRIIVRKTGVLFLGTLAMSLPLVVLFILFQVANVNIKAQYMVLLIVFTVLIFFAPRMWKRIQIIANRVFFSELYDELELLDQVSSELVPRSDPSAGLLAALGTLVSPLGLKSVSLVVPPGVINDNCWDFHCLATESGGISRTVNDSCHFLPWLNRVPETIVTEEVKRWPRDSEEERLGASMEANNLSACVPIIASDQRIGYLLVGEKVSRRAVSATDTDLLEKCAEHFGLYIDNYALATKLGYQIDEIKEVYSELHRAYDFKSEIIQVASHEFRSPITVIDGFVKTLVSNWDKFSDDEKVEYMESITKACKRLVDLTDKFLNISTLEEGDVLFSKVPVNLNDVLKELCGSLGDAEAQRIIIDGNPRLHVVSDPKQLKVVLENLIENALRFSPVDKPIVLRVWNDSSTSYIQVQDFGEGIPLSEHEKVFEPFVRLETVNHHSKGMGLGLHIVRLLCSRMGIEVEIESGGKVGTTVTLSFGL